MPPVRAYGLATASGSLVLTQLVKKAEIARAAGAQHPALASGPWPLSSSDCTRQFAVVASLAGWQKERSAPRNGS